MPSTRKRNSDLTNSPTVASSDSLSKGGENGATENAVITPQVPSRPSRWAEVKDAPSTDNRASQAPRKKSSPRTKPRYRDSRADTADENKAMGPTVFRSATPGEHAPHHRQTSHITENDREPSYRRELLRLFKERIRLVALFGVIFLPLLTAFYTYLAPDPTHPLARINGVLIFALFALGLSTKRLHRLSWARVHSLTGYVLFCTGSALSIMVVKQLFPTGDAQGNAVQFTVLACYVHILLSILLMPFTLWESLVVLAVVVGSVLCGLYWSSPLILSPTDLSQLFVLGTTGTLVVAISHVQSVLQRRSFDAAFDLARQAGKLQAVSATDALTGGFNRRHVEYILGAELTRSARFGHPLSLIMFDLDNFKPVNDTLGHAAGDQVLREIHSVALTTLREVDTLGRFGGDEFLIVLPETDIDSAAILAQRLKEATAVALRERFGVYSRQAKVTLSMGILSVNGQHWTLESALARVDELLYEAKRGGKNQIASNRRPQMRR